MKFQKIRRLTALAIVAALCLFSTGGAGATSDPSYQAPVYFGANGLLQVKAAAGPGILSDNGSAVFNSRFRVTIANVNAGVTVLPAITGYKYRLIDAALISVGGATATCATVDILGTQSSSTVKLVASAVAGLTQSALLRAGASNSTILADGASFNQNDAGAAITVGKTGGTCATATNIDFLLTYAIE